MGNLRYAIALTGAMGSGKSTLAHLLKFRGYEVLCADSLSHRILQECTKEIVELFGNGILEQTSLRIDRKKLGALVFSDKEALKSLESILHPRIRLRMLEQARELEKKCVPYFLDIPLFFEVGGRASYPVAFVLVVYASREVCLHRVKSRDCLSESCINARLDSQLDIEQKREMADFVIDNSLGVERLQEELEYFLQKLEAKLEGRVC